ncbi:unnamed protein product [Meganyctiphanes norvegica]|uniref:Major facilitator superfamily (MFS) profile domain-containing protein n=1 Tax=Meganyctiphanes norvegica TaxID=48144 RepID=A0AAV2R7E3_MEGNR
METSEHNRDKEELRSEDRGPLWGVRHTLALMGIMGVTCAYSMRVNLSIGIVAMVGKQNVSNDSTAMDVCPAGNSSSEDGDAEEGEFNWDSKTQGWILGAFYWGYAITNVMGGRSAEYFGSRRVFGAAIVVCSVLSCLLPVAASIHSGLFIAVRVLQGGVQGAVFPSLSFLLGTWIPPKDRGTYTTIVFSGLQVGTILTMSLGGVLCDSLGWPSVFYVFGGMGIVWGIPWFLLIHDRPDLHPRISKAELEYLQQDKDTSAPQKPLPVPWKEVMTSLPFWAMILASLGNNFGFFTLLTELPTYLSSIQHYDMQSSGFLSALPYLAMLVFSLIWIALIDYLSARDKITILTVRKLSNSVAIFAQEWLGVIVQCYAATQIGYTVVIDIIASMWQEPISYAYATDTVVLAGKFTKTFRFMLGAFGVIADIEKAFLRILIAERSKLITYRYKAVMFGSVSSPFLLAAVLQKLIKDD